MELERDFVGQITSYHCRNGPLLDRQSTDRNCCLIYIALVGLIFTLAVFSIGGLRLVQSEIEKQLDEITKLGGPMYAIVQAIAPILTSFAFVSAFCFIFVVSSIIIPKIVTHFYIPFSMAIMLAFGTFYLLRYYNIYLPLISTSIQQRFSASQTLQTIFLSIGFFVSFIFTFLLIFRKREKYGYIQAILRIGQAAFRDNHYLIIFSFFLTMLSVLSLFIHFLVLSVCLTKKEPLLSHTKLLALIIIEIIWTHGFIKGFSDFFFQSIATFWYYKKRRQLDKRLEYCDTLTLTFNLIQLHIGTISHGWILTFFPETINTLIGVLFAKHHCIYNTLFCWHLNYVRYLSKYGFYETIMQGFPFQQACKQMYGLRQRTKKKAPDLYLIGNLYTNIVKVMAVFFGLLTCYFLIDNSDLVELEEDLDFLGPIIFVLLGSLEISSHFLNTTGLIGDIMLFCYEVDLEIEKTDLKETEPYSCPNYVRDIIYQIKGRHRYFRDSS